MPEGPTPRRDEPTRRRRWFRRRPPTPSTPAPDQAVGDFGGDGQSDEGGDSDTT
jgi:hypothetical protein